MPINILRAEFVRTRGTEGQFDRNYPQMKMISKNNHGKVFDVENGVVKIWAPAKDIVEEFKVITMNQEEF
jgi:hypothetical protein